MSTVVLSTGPVTSADVLSVELVQSIELPDMIMIRWPEMPTVVSPRRFPAAGLAIIAVIDNAVMALQGGGD